MPKETFRIEGVGTLDISQINSSISKIQSTLSKIKLEPDIATDFTKLFNELQTEAQKFQNQLENGFKTKGDVTGLERTATKISTIFNQLTKDLNKVGTLDFSKVLKIDSSLQGKISGINEEIKNLNNSIKSITANNLQDVVNALSKLQTQGAKKAGLSILENFKAGDIQEAINLTDQLIKKQEQYQKQLETTGKNTSNVKANKDALNKLRDILNNVTKETKKYNNEINNLETNKIKELSQASENLSNDFDEASRNAQELRSSITSFTTEATSAANAQQRFNDEVSEVKNNIANFFSLANGVELFRDAVRSAFETVKELDAAMTETAVVTDFSVGDMWDQLPEYTERANQLGATTLGAYETMTLFYQQGLEQNEAFEIGTETMKMARIAGLDYASATDLMTAALRGFNMELNEVSAQRVNDVYSELAAVTASDTEEIGVAMSKTASIAASANMEFETTAAFLAQIIETTREAPETAGTAMKTIIARFTEVKELFDQGSLIGEDSEGQEININKIDTALQTVGISLKDFLTGARGLDDILLELASKWDTLDLATQRYIATTAAGSRQQSRFLAMMGDYDRTMELVDAAYNSTGASQAQFDKTLESLEAKLNKLSNAWNAFTMGLANSDLIKGAVDMLTVLLTGVNNLADSLGPVGGTITRFLAAFLGFKIGKNVFDNIFSSFTSTFAKMGTFFENEGQKAGKELGKGVKKGAENSLDNLDLSAQLQKAVNKIKNIKLTQTSLSDFGKQFGQLDSNFDLFAARVDSIFDPLKNLDDEIQPALKSIGNSLKNDLLLQLDAVDIIGDEALLGLRNSIKQLGNEASLDEFKNDIQQINNELTVLRQNGKNINISVNSNAIKSVNKSLGSTSQVIAQTQMGFSSIGSLFSQLGGTLGNFGTQLLGIGNIFDSIINLGTSAYGVFTNIANGATIAGIAIKSMLGPIALVAVALAALGGIAWASHYFSEGETLKRQLKEAQEATEATTQAAEDAQAAYEDVISAFDSYYTAQDALEKLTVGTLEWKEALIEVNQQVLDLISKYPELAQYVTTGKNGELTISQEGKEAYIAQRQESINATTTAQLAAQAAEAQVQTANNRYNLEEQIRNNPMYSGNKNIDDILSLYQESPEAFVAQSFDAQSLAEATNDQLIKLFEQSVIPMRGAAGLQDYLSFDEYGNYQGIQAGQEQNVIDQLRNSESEAGNYLQSLADSGNLTLYSDQLWDFSNGVQSTAQSLVDMSSDFAQFSTSSLEAESSIKGLLNTMLSTNIDESILQDEFGSVLTDAFGNIISDSMSEEISARATELNNQNDLAQLQQLYATTFHIPVDQIDENLKEDEAALANAIASFEISDEYASKVEETFQKITDDTSSSVRNFFGIMSQEVENLEDIDLNDLSTDEQVSAYLESVAAELGYTTEQGGADIEAFAESLGLDIEELTSQFANSIDIVKQQEKAINDSLATEIAKSGTFRLTNNSQDVLTSLLQLDAQQKSNIAELSSQIRAGLGEGSASNFLEGAIDIYANGTEQVKAEFENIFNDIDFSNPIQAFGALQTAIQSTEQDISALGQAMLVTSEDSLSTANQFQYFLESADFSEMNEQIAEFVEENGRITSANVKELAASCGNLSQMLNQTGMSADTAARLLNGINTGNLGIEDITDSLIIAISAFGKLDSVVESAFSTIDNFDPGRDTGEVGDWVNNVADTVIEMYDNGEYGNQQLQNYLKLLFGEEQWSQAVKNAKGNLDVAEKEFVDRLRVLEGNLYGAWHELATASQYQENLAAFNQENDTNIQISELNDGTIDLITNGATTDQVVQALADAYNISKEYAEMMLTDFYNFSGDLKTELAANDWAAGIEDYVKSREVTTMGTNARGNPVEVQTPVFSDKEIQKIAGETGMTEFQIWKDIAEQMGIATERLGHIGEVQKLIAQQGAVLQLLDEEGSLKSIDAINQELNTKLGGDQLNGLWANMFNGLRQEGTIAVEDIYNFLQGLGLDESTISQITSDAVEALEASGQETEITVGGVAMSEEEKAQLETDTKGVIENGAENADMTKLSDTLSTAITEGITGTDDSAWFSGLSTAASENINSAYSIISGKTQEIVDDNKAKTSTMASDFESASTTMSDAMSSASSSITSSLGNVETAASDATTEVKGLRSSISSLSGKTITVTANLRTNHSGFRLAGSTYSVEWFASGSSGLKKDTLGVVGDGGGPELILGKNGNVRLAGINGPEVTQLQKGDQIYTAEKTRNLLKGKTNIDIPKFSRGYTNQNSQTWTGYTGNGASNSSSSSSNKTSGSSSSSKKEAEEEKEIWENTYDWLYNLTEDINEALRERERIERRYDEILKDRSTTYQDLLDNVYDQLDALQKEYDLQEEMLQKRTEEMQRYLKENQELSKYATFNWEDQTIEINWDEIDKVTDVDTGDRIEEYISKLEEIQEEMESANDSLYDIKDSMQELEDIGKEDFLDFEQRVMDAVIGYYQDQIDELSLIDESINDANTKLMDSIRNSVDQMRQQRENEQTEQSLSDKERRLAYLRQDTSGGNQLEIKQLEEEIANERQNYTDSLVDQKLQEFENQNNLASEQRQKQIELAQASLDMAQETGDLWKNVQELIKAGVDAGGKLVTGSQLDKLLKSQEGWAGLSNTQKMDWLKEIEQALKISGSYYEQEKDDIYGNSYNPNVDYTQKILDMLNSGNIDYHQLAVWEQQRNAKIIAEGMDVPLRYEYVQYLSDYDPSVDYTQKVYDYLAQGNYLMAAISQLQRNQKIKDLGLDYTLEYDLLPYLIAGNTDNPLLDYSDYEVDYGGYLPRGYSLDTYDNGYAYLMSSEMPTYGNTSYYQSSGDNYYEIHIDVESLSSDYDVDQIADKVKRQINEDARYRNVNAINRLR